MCRGTHKKLIALAESYYQRTPEIAEGFTAEDYASDAVEPLPDTEAAYGLMMYLRTQWIQGFNGPVGINYAVMHHKMGRMGLSPEEFDQLERDIQVMEVAALNCIHAKP